MAAHIQHHAAACTLWVPEPVGMRPRMLLTVPHEKYLTQRAGVSQFLGAHILRNIGQHFGIDQLHAVLTAGVPHLLTLSHREAQRFLT